MRACPLPNLGIELQHIDFGHAKFQFNDFEFPGADARAQSTALFGMGMLPLPVRSLDLFAKVGVGALHQTSTSYSCTNFGCSSLRDSTTSARFGWGLGAQFKWSSLAVRTEALERSPGWIADAAFQRGDCKSLDSQIEKLTVSGERDANGEFELYNATRALFRSFQIRPSDMDDAYAQTRGLRT